VISDHVWVDPVYRPGLITFPRGLSDGRVALRAWTYGDLAWVEEASQVPVIPAGTTVPNHFTEASGRSFIERQWGRWESGEGLSMAITDALTGTAVGFVTVLHRQQPGVAGLGYGIAASRRDQQFASGGARLLSRWALSLPTLHRLEALVEPRNLGSIRVLEKIGFRREGLLRKYLDVAGVNSDAWLYSLLPDDIGDEIPRAGG
jgi:[ribosomal protein S5]-alanine N-acetyltransferase